MTRYNTAISEPINNMKPVECKEWTNLATGLTAEQASQAARNIIETNPQKPIKQLVFEEVFSFFNIINYILAAFVLYTGSYRNLMFLGIVLCNTVVSLYQKIHSRHILNKLALLHAQKYEVLRDGRFETVAMDKIVEGDLIRLGSGSQIPCDGIVRKGECQVNESLLTGEADALERNAGGSLYGGCFVVSGNCLMQAVLVGDAQYMASIIKEAKRDTLHPSKLRDSLDSLIKFCSIIIFPAGAALFLKLILYSKIPLNDAILNTTASMIGMIPEGLIILTSTALATAAVKMARKKVLVHELYCIENLARVDTLCLDKTGTITSGKMNVKGLVPASKDYTEEDLKQMISDLMHSLEDDNLTAEALHQYTEDLPATKKADKTFPFSSAKKCSAAVFGDETYYLGAYTFLFEHVDSHVMREIDQYAEKGLRVLVLAKGPQADSLEKGNYELCGLILIEDELRPNVENILGYFKKQDVTLKVISGDNPTTVASIARRAGLEGKSIDMSTVSDDQIRDVVREYSIFGRVTPDQKREMVTALQKLGHCVGMTGDGVNDVMALKQADCSIAMGTGAQAAMSVASMVLLQDQFSAMPDIVSHGRCVVNNIQRTASLFLVKTVFSFLLTVLTVVWMREYPFVPIQLTLISSICIGMPAFFLTFEYDISRIRGNFLVSVLSRAIPGAVAVSSMICVLYILVNIGFLGLSPEVYKTMCTLLTMLNGMLVLYMICYPMSILRLVVMLFCLGCGVVAVMFLRPVFMLQPLPWYAFLCLLALGAGDAFMMFWLAALPWRRILSRFIRLKKPKKSGKKPE